MKITISKENYLKAIAEAESEGETVIAATLTRWLNVSAPAVTMAIKRLKRDGHSLDEIAARTGLHPSSVRRILYDLARRLALEAPPEAP